MAKKFNPNKANLTQPKREGAQAVLDNVPDTGRIFSPKYYNLETGDILPLERIEKRIDDEYNKIDKSTAQIALDVFFVHENFKTKYDRAESWSAWVKEHVRFERTHVYDLMKIVGAIKDVINSKREKEGIAIVENYDELLLLIQKPFEDNPVKTLKYAAQIEDEDKKAEVFEAILEGKEISQKSILSINKENASEPEAEISLEPETARGLETTVVPDKQKEEHPIIHIEPESEEEDISEASAVKDRVIFKDSKEGYDVYYLANGELWSSDKSNLETRIGVFEDSVKTEVIRDIARTILNNLVTNKGTIWK